MVLLGIIVGLVGCNSETARWEFAQALRLMEKAETDAALDRMRQAVRKSGDHWELALPFAIELAKRGDQEALAICDQILASEEIRQTPWLNVHARKVKIECQKYLGDFSGALTTFKTLHRDRVIRSHWEDNDLAYTRALAGRELDLAYNNITHAMQAAASDWLSGERLSMREKCVVASVLLARYCLAEAQQNPHIEPAARAEKRLLETSAYLSVIIEEYVNEYGRIIECVKSNEKSDLSLERCTAKSNLIALLTVRALVFQDLKEWKLSQEDREHASQMTEDLEKVLQGLPGELSCLEFVMHASALLDTYGFIQSRLPWQGANSLSDLPASSYRESLSNLNVAVLATEVLRRAFAGKLVNRISLANVPKMQTLQQRSEAVLRYHRMLTHQRAGQIDLAERDRIAIVDLGFQPGRQLF
jgi:hypothetical protein